MPISGQVQFCVLGAHHLGRKEPDNSHGAGRTLLEGDLSKEAHAPTSSENSRVQYLRIPGCKLQGFPPRPPHPPAPPGHVELGFKHRYTLHTLKAKQQRTEPNNPSLSTAREGYDYGYGMGSPLPKVDRNKAQWRKIWAFLG